VAKRKAIPIRLEDPPDSNRGKAPAGGALQDLIQRLGAEAPGQWSLLDRKKKNIGYLYSLKKRHPKLEVRSHKNADGTHGVWLRVGKPKRKVVKRVATKKVAA
jgi:hypothetical protein